MEKSLGEFIKSTCSQYSGKNALVQRTEYRRLTWKYSELYDLAGKTARYLKNKGLKKGDKIVLYLPNSPEYVSLLFACALSGVVAVPIDFNSNKEFVKLISEKTKAKIIFTSFYKKVDSEKELFVENLSSLVKDLKTYESKSKPSDLFEIVYTSGTTSEPKGVMITHENILSNVRSLGKIINLKRNRKFLSVLPLSHLLEQTLGLFGPLNFGGTVTHINSRKSRIISEAIKEEKITTIVTVPAFLETLKDKIEVEIKKQGKEKQFHGAKRLSEKMIFPLRRKLFKKIRKKIGDSLEFFIVGGSALHPETENFWNSLGVLVLQGYGLTETSPIITCNSFKERKLNTVGKILPSQEIMIAKDGEILAKGFNITKGYYQNKSETSKLLKDGWLHTGDLGELDAEGFLQIKGRKKNMILTDSGINIYPEDIENKLNSEKEIKDSCVLGLKERDKIILTAIILPKNKLKEKTFLENMNKKLASHQKIQRLVIWPEKDFPRTPSLKIKKRDVEKKIENNSFKETKKSSNKLYSLLERISKTNSKINSRTTLVGGLGLDSLARIELISLIEEEYNLEIEEEKINEKTTVKELEKIIKNTKKTIGKTKPSFLNNSNAISVIRKILQAIIFPTFNLITFTKIKGKRDLKNVKQAIFVSNHTSHLDTFTILRKLPRKIRKRIVVAAAADYFFEKSGFWKKANRTFKILLLNIFPFSRTSQVKESLRLTGKLLNNGNSLLIFPEGTRTNTGKMNSFKTGIGLIANQMELPVVPIKVEGLDKILPKGKNIPKPGRSKITFGKPIEIDKTKSFIEITKDLEEAVKEL